MLRRVDPVDAADELFLVAGGGDSVGDAAAGIVGNGDVLGDQIHGLRIKPRHGNLVVWEGLAGGWIPQCPGAARDAGRRVDGAEIAVENRRRRYKADGLRRIAALPRSLEPAEEEQLVADDPAAQRSTELVALERVMNSGERISSIQIAVAQKFEQVAVEAVGARPRHCIDHRPGMQSETRRKKAGLHAELLERVRKRDWQVAGGDS